MLGGDPEPMFKHLRETDVVAVSEPFAEAFLPGIDDESCRLLDPRECLEFRCRRPPGRARLELMHSLGPKLVARVYQAIAINHASANNRPEPPRAGRILQIVADDRIDGGREHALSRQADRVLAVGWTETIASAGEERLDGG